MKISGDVINELVKHIPLGSVLLTRGYDDNRTPGYWNHMAIYIGNGEVVEAQQSMGGVIKTSLEDFVKRYYRVSIYAFLSLNYVRHSVYNYKKRTISKSIPEIVTEIAKDSIGTKYWILASIFRRLRMPTKGENCVSLVRRCYKKAFKTYGKKLRHKWTLPDDFYRTHEHCGFVLYSGLQ